MTDRRRELPSVDRLLRDPAIADLLRHAPRNAVVAAAREVVHRARVRRAGPPPDWGEAVREQLLDTTSRSLRPVLNATGVVLHTNLGRAPLAPAALAALTEVAAGYSTLEYDLHAGTRGHRADHCRTLLAELTGAEDGLAVNNAAGALVVALNAVAAGRRVLISRGELIEIGGSFRIPDIMAKSGAVLAEVGTTNRTHVGDYAAAVTDAAAILTVHRSNFEQRGFVASPRPVELAALARQHGIPYLYDVGSGLLADLSAHGLVGEPRVPEAVAAGASLVLFSGDKLLGGPQAGCVVGTRALVAAVRSNPFARAMRADKLTLAALEATLTLYRDPARALAELPVLAMLTTPPEILAARAQALATASPAVLAPRLVPGQSAVGGGAFPEAPLPTTLVALDPGALGAHGLALRLRLGEPALVVRVEGGQVLLDPRTVPPERASDVGRALAAALQDP